MTELVRELRSLVLDCAGVLASRMDLSEVGGEGGVGVSEAVDDTDFVGGVAMVGDEAVVVDGECSEMEDLGRGMLAPTGVGFRSLDLSFAASA